MVEYPSDWKVVCFEDCFELRRTNTCSRAMMSIDGCIGNVHYGDVLIRYGSVLDLERKSVPYLTSEGVGKASMDYLQDGDIVLADTAEDESCGKVVELRNVGNRKVVSGLHTVFCRPKIPEMFESGWLGYWMNSSAYHGQLLSHMTGIKVLSVSKASLKKTWLLIPPLPEQKRIAKVLDDVDRLIENLGKRIAKKRLIKKGVSQELLTGKKRLPGFEGSWSVDTMAGRVFFDTGFPFSSEYFNTNGEGLRLVRNRDLKSDDQIVYSSEAYDDSFLVANGDLLVCMDGDFVVDFWRKGRALLNQRMGRIRPRKELDLAFAKYALDEPLRELQEDTSATTVKHLSHGSIASLKVLMPPSLLEQRAIAKVLSDMDEEIANLEARQSKLKLVKKGMLQDLLTGKVRLK